MAVVVVAPDGGFPERSVHALALAVGPGVIGLGQSMIDVVLGTGELEAVRPDEFSAVESLTDDLCCRGHIAGRGELHPIARWELARRRP